MSNQTFARIQLDSQGNEIDPSALAPQHASADVPEYTAVDVNALNTQLRAASEQMRQVDADQINREREMRRSVQESDVFAQRAADAAAQSDAAFKRGDHAAAQRHAGEAARLNRLAERTAHNVLNRVELNHHLDVARAGSGPSTVEKLQAELQKQIEASVWRDRS